MIPHHHRHQPDSPGGNKANCSTSKPICSICYEDLKPILEDLQSISICGHVFHELCLQQWLEYCPAGKKCTCPVCKQSCTGKDIIRLYFQSTGNDSTQISSSQMPFSEAEAEVLRGDIKKLEGKLSALTFAFGNQKLHVDELSDELLVWKERAKKEETMKDEFRREKELIHHLLQTKQEDLCKTSAECKKLQERSLALAKELAALKLATDVNLGEDEMVKLASVGHGTKHTDAIDVFKKSLVLRNKSYKELMAQCNLLGRAETRSLKKLEKAEEKVKKLKARLREVEKALEEKDNGILRDLKGSKRITAKVDLNDIKQTGNSPYIGRCSSKVQIGNSPEVSANSHLVFPKKNINWPYFQKDLASETNKEYDNVIDLKTDSCFSIDKDGAELSPNLHGHLDPICEHQNSAMLYEDVSLQKPYVSGPAASSSARIETYQQSSLGPGYSGSRTCITSVVEDGLDRIMEGNVPHIINPVSAAETLVIDDDFEQAPMIPITKKSLAHDLKSCLEAQTFPGRLIEPEGANKYAGKWCRRARANVSPTMQASTSSGSLIAVGADGRGGRIKVLRTHDRFSDGKAQSIWPKKAKCGTKLDGQSRGCLQIEHFFGKMEG